MSMQTKMRNAQQAACIRERDRVMRICTHVIDGLRKGFNKKLMSSAEKHLAEVKLNIASAVVGAIQLKVMSGSDPDAQAEASQIHGRDADAVGDPQGDPDRAS